MHWEFTKLVYVAIYDYHSQWLLCHHTCSCACTRCDHKLQATWADASHMPRLLFCMQRGKNSLGMRLCTCPHAIKSCLPCVYPWRHTHDQLYQTLPLLNERAWEWGYRLASLALPYRMFWGAKTLPVYICGFPAKYTWSGKTCLGERTAVQVRGQCEPQ